jgi:hypothetical protein
MGLGRLGKKRVGNSRENTKIKVEKDQILMIEI